MNEKFRLNRINVLLIIVSIICFLFFVGSIVVYVNSLKNTVNELPVLDTTGGRTSTKTKKTTTEETTTTTTTTQKRELVSPYYSTDLIALNNEVLTSTTIKKDTADQIFNILFKFTNGYLNMNDDSLLDITTTVNYAKDGEVDKIIYNNNAYGIIYNNSDILNLAFTNDYKSDLKRFKYNDAYVFTTSGDNTYRLAKPSEMGDIIVSSYKIESYSSANISASVIYYMSNYEALGYSSPNYSTVKFDMTYYNKRWRVAKYEFPLYTK